ncbi:MAG: sensor histidine kinase [Flavobacteriales bacterium]
MKTIIEKYNEINTNNFDEKIKEVEALRSELDYNFLVEELNGIISSIENGANRTTEIVRSLRNFSRLDESDLMLADINEGIESTLVLLRSEYTGIEIRKELGNLPKIECYPGKLNQVFLNLLNNAIHAVNDKKDSENKKVIEIRTFSEDETIGISIKDNGIGMNKDTQNKIFDPFFTTKEVGKGTGLGLSIVYRIIENHHGTIHVESEENNGTIFTLNLPKHQKQ